MCNKNIYKASFTNEVNPNRNKASNYNIEIGTSNDDTIKYVKEKIKEYTETYDSEEKQKLIFTNNPLYELK